MAARFTTAKILVLLLFLLISFSGSSQEQNYQKLTFRIDSLAAVGLPQSALKEVDKLDRLARNNHHTSQLLKAAFYRLTFITYLEENALVAVINSLKKDIAAADYPEKPVLQSVLAEVYYKYYQQHRYQFSQRSQLSNPSSDFTQWDLRTILQQVSHLHQSALRVAPLLQKTPVSALGQVLMGDTATRSLRPTLYDLLVHRALEFYLHEEADLPKPRYTFSLNNTALFSNSRTFVNLSLPTQDTSANLYKGLQILQQASRFHLKQNNPEALADLELQRVETVFQKSTFPARDSLYLSQLNQIAQTFVLHPISADALYKTGQYYQEKDSLVKAITYYRQATQRFPESIGGQNAANAQEGILQKSISAQWENVVPAQHPILALTTFRNLSQAETFIYKLTPNQITRLTDLLRRTESYNHSDHSNRASHEALAFLRNMKPLQQNKITLLDRNDYQTHKQEFKINPLNTGHYAILIQGGSSTDTTLLQVGTFTVSNLAYISRINPNGLLEVRVMNRITGKPLPQVQVALAKKIWVKKSQQTRKVMEGVTNKAGKITLNPPNKSEYLTFTLVSDGDTLRNPGKYVSAQIIQNKEDEEEEQTILFTDRQIYRPGQVIYFKGIQVKKVKSKSELVTGKKLEVEFNDVNYKTIDTLKVKTNAFGSFSGSFQLPLAMLTGKVTIETSDGEVQIRVEEYRRPSFQVDFDTLKENYRLNDSVILKGQVLALAGYGLSGSKIEYKISRQTSMPLLHDNYYHQHNFSDAEMELQSGTVHADAAGNFFIRFKAVAEMQASHLEQQYLYRVMAAVTDAAGETQEGATAVRVGQQVVDLQLNLPQQLILPDSLTTQIRLTNLNNQLQAGKVIIQIFRLQPPTQPYKERLWEMPDVNLWTKNQFENSFPDYAFFEQENFHNWPICEQIHTQTFTTNAGQPTPLQLSLVNQKAGVYLVQARGFNLKGDSILIKRYVTLISNSNNKPARIADWIIPVKQKGLLGKKAVFLVGASKSHILMEVYQGSKLISSEWIVTGESQKIMEVSFKATSGKQGRVQFLMVRDNRVYTISEKLAVSNQVPNLALKFTTFRNKLEPGQKETWKLQVTNFKNQEIAAEMIASLYDASLNQIAPSSDWSSPFEELFQTYEPNYNYYSWQTYDFVRSVSGKSLHYPASKSPVSIRDYEHLNFFGFNYYGGYNHAYRNYLERLERQNKMKKTDQKLEEEYEKNAAALKNGVEVSGRIIDGSSQMPLPGVTVMVRGTKLGTLSNSEGYFKMKVLRNSDLIFSFIGYTTQEVKITKASNFIITLVADMRQLSEVVVAGYGTTRNEEIVEVASEVLVEEQALHGIVAGVKIQSAPDRPEAKQIIVRKNLQETAFFYPQLLTNEKGDITISFTVPEALTQWQFKGMAHTRALQWGYTEGQVVTQKKLMITPYLPRFLREGDTLTVAARVVNLSNAKLTGRAKLQLFNTLTNQPVNLLLNKTKPEQDFSLAAGTTGFVSFSLVIPKNLEVLTYRITAETTDFSDGEENTVPVLPNALLVTESVPLLVRPGQTKTFTLNKLVNTNSTTLQSQSLTIEYTQNPVWSAVEALPYLMEFPYECAEQTFSRYYANCLAAAIVEKSPVIKQVFAQWQVANTQELLSKLESNPELKQTLLTETPWLRDATSETEQKKRLALLFDRNQMEYASNLNLDKLAEMQFPDGSFPWFAGMPADRYISQHIVAGLGQLQKLGLSVKPDQKFQTLKIRALAYLDTLLIRDEHQYHQQKLNNPDNLFSSQIHAWYARSYFVATPFGPPLQKAWETYRKLAATDWKFRTPSEKALMALTLHRFNQPIAAKQIIQSLLETAKQTEELGMYWPKNQMNYWGYQSPVETQVLLIELFDETSQDSKLLAEMKIWLLRHKQTNNWRTTKATAAACYALLLQGEDWQPLPTPATITLSQQPLPVLKPELTASAGSGYLKTNWVKEAIKPALGKVEIKNNGEAVSWGALHWQYLEQTNKITASETQLKLRRQYFIQQTTTGRDFLTPVDSRHLPKVGDLLKVVIHLESDREMEYVQLKDLRPAGTEPADALSGYTYQDGLHYYQSTRDAATNFFISNVGKGKFVFEYRLRVAHPGEFATGITSIQSMYAPEFNAHSEGSRIQFTR